MSKLSATKRELILNCANKVFLKQGFEHASMDQVAATAGVSKMTVYRHFVGKEALFASVVHALCMKIVDDDLESVMESRPPKEALRVFAQKNQATVFAPQTIELHRMVISESRRFPDLGRLFYENGPDATVKLLTRYLESNLDDPHLVIDSPKETAEMFMTQLRGYEHLRLLFGLSKRPNRRVLERQLEKALSLLIR